ncbi:MULTISPECIES: SpoIIE family protein phosphatase [unclassified Streptomyces]|uniref:SpoIIE family protein phosphatase n=1 Tax=unclassified Streptomyces TaxID=2593676 RepID=UPI0033B926CC
MTTTSTARVTLGKRIGASDISDTALALLDEQGTVVAWTQTAQHLVGYTACAVVGRSAALVLPSFGEASAMSTFVEQCRARNGWSGATAVRHQDGRVLDVGLRISPLQGQDGAMRWLATLTDIGVPSADAASGSVWGALLDRAPIGVFVRDLELRGAWVNDVMESQDGISATRRLGCRPTDVWWSGVEAATVEAMMRQVLRSGTTTVHEYRAWLPTSRDLEHPFGMSFTCLQGADGQPLGVCIISVDLAESRRVRERLAVLGEAGPRFGSTLDVMQTAQELAELAVPQFADFVTVDLEQSALFGEGAPVRIGAVSERLPVLRRAGLASIRQGASESPWGRGEAVPVPPDAPLFEILRTGRSYLEPVLDTATGSWIDQDPIRAQKIRENGMHSMMLVPIRVRRVLLGMALFIRTENPTPFQEDDVLLAEELVRRAAVALDNARQYCREQTAALALQHSLLPRRLSGGAAVETASRYQPADIDRGVGGDWFDVIPLSGARVALVVGDVVGHGIGAAARMGRLRAAVRALSDLELPPGELLSRLDNTVQRVSEEDGDDPGQNYAAVGATCLYAVYDPVTRRCAMAAAGHPPPAIIDPQGKVTFPDLPTGAPLGIGLGARFEAMELELPENTLLAFYTDGVIETRDQDIEEGMHRLGTVLAQPGRSLEELCTRAMASVEDQAAFDDASLLLVRTRSLSPAQVTSWTLPSDRTTVRHAWTLAAGQLAEWGLEGLVDGVKQIVSELVTNVVRRSDGPIRLRLIRHQALTVEVIDADVNSPCMCNARTVDEHGRDLTVAAQLFDRWGTRETQDGKIVWVEADLAHTSRSQSHAAR